MSNKIVYVGFQCPRCFIDAGIIRRRDEGHSVTCCGGVQMDTYVVAEVDKDDLLESDRNATTCAQVATFRGATCKSS